MGRFRSYTGMAALGFLLFFVGVVESFSQEAIPVPKYLLKKQIAQKTNPIEIADTFLRIPYRNDGTIDERGDFVTFNKPGKSFRTPGLNCSGLVLSVSRYLLMKNFTLKEAARDRQGNSGADAPLGKDWDFGWDLIFNLSDGLNRRVILPEGYDNASDSGDGQTLRGFDMHDPEAWSSVLAQMSPGHLYLVTLSKPTKKKGYQIIHYHTAFMLVGEKGEVWVYQATRRSRTHRINLKTPQGMKRFMAQFRKSGGVSKNILILETTLPHFDEQTKTTPDQSSLPPPETPVKEAPAEENSPKGSPLPSLQIPSDNKTVSETPAQDSSQDNGTNSEAPDQDNQTGSEAPAQGSSQDNGTDSEAPTQDNGTASGAQPASTAAQNLNESEEETGPPSEKPAPSPASESPNLAVNHVMGKVLHAVPDLVAHIPSFSSQRKDEIKFWFRNRSDTPHPLRIRVRNPEEELSYSTEIPARGQDLSVIYPRDFGKASEGPIKLGKYEVETQIGGQPWYVDKFEVVVPAEALPKITKVDVPAKVKANTTFNLKVIAENKGEQSDYGGITVSSPDPSGLKLVSAKPGRLYGKGSTVLSVTSDKINTKVPMAERWIKLWGENEKYDMTVKVQALRPGVYPLYVRCAVRGVNVKSSVTLMEPASSEVADQQGFPVYVYEVTVE